MIALILILAILQFKNQKNLLQESSFGNDLT